MQHSYHCQNHGSKYHPNMAYPYWYNLIKKNWTYWFEPITDIGRYCTFFSLDFFLNKPGLGYAIISRLRHKNVYFIFIVHNIIQLLFMHIVYHFIYIVKGRLRKWVIVLLYHILFINRIIRVFVILMHIFYFLQISLLRKDLYLGPFWWVKRRKREENRRKRKWREVWKREGRENDICLSRF